MRKNIIKLLSLALALVLTMGSQPAFASSKDSLPVGLSLQEGYYNVDGNIIIYINWDAFAEYYYDLAQQGGTSRTPVLNSLIAEGVHFTDMNSGLPSITNPMQTAILSGAWPETTMNPYRYYNPVQDKVIGFARENEAENMAQAMVRQGFRVASVNQFVLESREEANVYHGKKYYDKGCAVGNKQAAYFTSGDNGLDRFDGMIALIKGEPVGTGANRMQLDKLPNFIAGYMDDLDALGHNETAAGYDGVAQATTEQGRRDNVLNRLELLDAKLGELVAACKATGLYDRMTFVLGTDHGMHPFGSQNGGTDDYTVSKLQGIYDIISEHGVKYEYVAAGKVPLSSTQLVIVSAGLQLQFTLKDSTVPQATMDAIMTKIAAQPYVGKVLNKQEIAARGAIADFADYIVSPKAPYHFKPGTSAYKARGQHESQDDTAQKVFALMWGNGLKKGVTYGLPADIIDLIPTAAAAAGVGAPANATGQVLTDALVGGSNPVAP